MLDSILPRIFPMSSGFRVATPPSKSFMDCARIFSCSFSHSAGDRTFFLLMVSSRICFALFSTDSSTLMISTDTNAVRMFTASSFAPRNASTNVVTNSAKFPGFSVWSSTTFGVIRPGANSLFAKLFRSCTKSWLRSLICPSQEAWGIRRPGWVRPLAVMVLKTSRRRPVMALRSASVCRAGSVWSFKWFSICSSHCWASQPSPKFSQSRIRNSSCWKMAFPLVISRSAVWA
mmetsp:Transcript_8811/g.22208  ORF Transcript_8811/g.22208 Transcript_8811/m.22208 type:complete len:232 (-) Transcript_8811:733-1428(-)